MKAGEALTAEQARFLAEYVWLMGAQRCCNYLKFLGKEGAWVFCGGNYYPKPYHPKPKKKCSKCGQLLRWEFVLKNKKNRECVRVGSECLTGYIVERRLEALF